VYPFPYRRSSIHVSTEKAGLYMPFEAPTFPILLVVCGLIVLGWEVGRRSTSHEKDS